MAKSDIFRSGNRTGGYASRASAEDAMLASSIMRTGAHTVDATNLPEHLANFKILERLGRGERGVVYKAVDPANQRRVAIKTIPAAVGYGQDAINTFTRDTDLAKKLRHACVATTYAAGFEDHKPYIVMDLFPGMDLLRFVRKRGRFASSGGQIINGPTTIPEMLQIMLQIARGLSAAHRIRLFHGDLKPSHIWCTDKRQIKILDFGIAKLAKLNAQTHISDSTACKRDLFALGCIGYYLLTGQSPFRAGETDVFSDLDVAHPLPPITPLVTFRSDVPAKMEKLLMQLLHTEALDAFSSVDEFLKLWLPLVSPLIRFTAWLQDFIRTQIMMVGIAAITVLVLATLMLVSSHLSCGEGYKVPDAPAYNRSGLITRKNPPKVLSVEDEKNWAPPKLFNADGSRVLEGKENGLVREFDTTTGKETQRWVGHEEPICALSLSANGRWLITADTSGIVYVWNHDEGRKPTWAREIPSGQILAAWTTDSGDRMLLLVNEEEGKNELLEYEH